jgi:hypothetical protein
LGRVHNKEVLRKLSITLTGLKKTEQHKINIGKGHCKKVINCRDEVFSSTNEAANFYNISRTAIKNNLNNKSESSGKYPDGTKIEWKFYNGESNAST